MSPVELPIFTDIAGVPRASGDEPPEDIAGIRLATCSPRERG